MAQPLDRPHCVATIADDDSVEVTIDGASSTHPSMTEALHELGAMASDLGRPLKVTALDPASTTDPQTHLLVHPDGRAETDTQAATKQQSRRSQKPSRAPARRSPQARGTGDPGGADTSTATPEVAAPINDAAPTPLLTAEPELEAPAEPTTEVGVDNESERDRLDGPDLHHRVSAPVVVDRGDDVVKMPAQTDSVKAASPARFGWRGWLNLHAHSSLAPSTAELASRDRRRRIQRPLDGHRTIAVIQLKGGGSKTTTTFHIAATYGRIRGGNILAGEFNENQGTLAERSLKGAHERTTLDLIRNLDTITRRTSDLVRYVRPQGDDRIHVLASPPEGTDRRRVDGRSVTAAHETLSSLYSLILLDTGNSAQSTTWQAAVDVADSLVLVAHNREDDARLLEATVAAVRAEGHADKLQRSILVIANTAAANRDRLTRFRQYGDAVGLAGVHVIPFDRSLQEGQAFSYEHLAPATVKAWEDATAALTDQL